MSYSSSSSSDLQDTVAMSEKEYVESLYIPSQEIETATNKFSIENLIAQGSSFRVFKGQLSNSSINIVARISRQFNVVVNEVTICKFLSHKNISSTFKIADDDDYGIIINKHEANGSLDIHLRGSSLSWIQRLKICLGVAHALSYIHRYDAGDGDHIIHANIKTSKILLDDNWEPKLHGFGFAHRVKRNHGYITSKYNGSLQYMDPAYENTKTLSYKSDVFSFGVVLFEVLFGTIASVQNWDHMYFARLARLHYQQKTLDDMIDPDLRIQMELQSLKIFSETAYYCLKELRGERPDTDQIVKRLETALELQLKHQTPLVTPFPPKKNIRNPLFRFIFKEHSPPAVQSNHLKGKNLDHLKIRLSDIHLATNNFSPANVIGSGGFGTVYKAELDHFDGKYLSEMEGRNKGKFPKIRSTVAIKRLFSRLDAQGEEGFFAEIELLIKCKHPNIVTLCGFCEEGREQILVYEYASNGSLNDYMGNINNMTKFTWAQRIQICLDIANGLKYLHSSTQDKQMIIHRDIKSDNILLYDNWVAKIADFGLSKLRPANQKASTLNTNNIAGTEVYLDPEYLMTGKLKKESDIYSYGVVLFEIMCGRVAYDEIFNANNDNGLPSTVRRCYNEGTLKDLVDPKLKEAHENIFMLSGGLDENSLDTFIKIAYQCLANIQAERPTTKVIIEELEKALNFQKNSKDNLQILLRDIKLGTQNFSDDKCIGEGRFWKQYEGEIPHGNDNICTTLVAKRFNNKSIHGHQRFFRELEVLLEYKHDNIIALVGYCNEMDEKIIVYEHVSNGSLDKHLGNTSLSWIKRLKICIDIANGLDLLYRKDMIHRDIKSASIVIDSAWKAKISNLELVSKFWEQDKEISHVAGSLSYIDPLYKKQGYLNWRSDIYSLGVVLIEMLSGRLASSFEESLGDLVQKCKQSAKAFHELVFKDIKQHSDPQSLASFCKIAYACLESEKENRPYVDEVVIRLKKALELQEDYEIWEPKLPMDYKEIILMSNAHEMYSNESKKDIYDMLTKGILLQEGKLCFILGSNGERNEMISATNFSFKNRSLRKWQRLPESRFPKIAQILDITNLKIQIKIKTQLLSPGVNYVVHLVFKFHIPKTSTAKLVYVNLKYKLGGNNLHAYFATRREDGWMTIELGRFLNQKKDTDFEVLLESFSRCYCGKRLNCVYVEGIEFRAIENVKYEETEKLNVVKQVLKSTSNLNEVGPSCINSKEILSRFVANDEGSTKLISFLRDDEQLILLYDVTGKKHLMISSIWVLYDTSKVKPFYLKHSAESRFLVVVKLLAQQVFGIKCKIGSRWLSPDTDYVCYLVFKLSEKCRGLHCPVRVRNVLQWKHKEIGLVCFRPTSPWSYVNDSIWVPKEREDGWMEVIVWKFNSTSHIRNDRIPLHLKLITYEGTMSGLIVSGLEIRSI